VMEGVSFALNDSLCLIKNLEANVSKAVAVGGGVSSPIWLQMLSDVMNLPLHTVTPKGGASLGAAMLASVGTGIFDNVSDVFSAWLNESLIVSPDASRRILYDDAYVRYRSLYPALREIFSE
ncbi:MAG: xylulokinase, partial [SAR202 cluster bacterium]